MQVKSICQAGASHHIAIVIIYLYYLRALDSPFKVNQCTKTRCSLPQRIDRDRMLQRSKRIVFSGRHDSISTAPPDGYGISKSTWRRTVNQKQLCRRFTLVTGEVHGLSQKALCAKVVSDVQEQQSPGKKVRTKILSKVYEGQQ